MQKDRIIGMFLGVAIGDSLGLCCEGWSAAKIKEVYGRITFHHEPKSHNLKIGSTSDDTQLTLAVAEAILEDNLSMESQVKHHIAAFQETTAGWGNTTRDSVRRLANGANWASSGNGSSGLGNGVAMKIAPMGVYLCSVHPDRQKLTEGIEHITKINLMTHRTSVSASAALAHAFGIYYCCTLDDPKDFSVDKFQKMIIKASSIGRQMFAETLTDDITNRFEVLFQKEHDTQKLIDDFGGGSCYCYNSLPFSYGFFLQNPNSIESLYNVVNAGGDTDSNASMVGALLGALHGTSIFPEHLIGGLVDVDKVLAVAERFAEKFAT